MSETVDEIAKEKHDKAAIVDFNRVLRPLCNILAEICQDYKFGYFEEVRRKPFSGGYEGVFRHLRGSSQPFVDLLDYTGDFSFHQNQVILISMTTNVAIDMTPLYVWGINLLAGDTHPADLYMFDSQRGGDFVFNAVQERSEVVLNEGGSLSDLWALTKGCREHDQECTEHANVSLSSRAT